MTSPVTDFATGFVSSTAVKQPCDCATTAAITLEGLQTVDGISLAENMRVLVKNQTSQIENGIYVVSTGMWVRASDLDDNYDIEKGTRVFVAGGSTNGTLEFYVSTANPISIGTTGIVWTQATTTGSSTVPTSRTITAGAGLAGGGNLSNDITLALDIASLSPQTSWQTGDYLPFYRGGAHYKITYDNAFSGFVRDTRTVGTDTGLTGGGSLAGDRTIALNINALSAPASVDTAADFVLLWDTSAGQHRKATPDSLFTGVSVSADDIDSGTLDAARLPASGAVSDTYGSATAVAQVAVDATGRITSASDVTISIPFTAISDGAGAFTGQANKFVRVNAGETGLEYALGASVADFTDLGDVPASYTGQTGKFLRVNAGETALEFAAGAAVADFTDLGDVPASYAGAGNYIVKVNSGATALEFSATLPANAVPSAAIQSSAVTLAKMENRSASTLIGRYSGTSGAPQECTLGTALSFSGPALRVDLDALSAEPSPATGDYLAGTDTSGSGASRKFTVSSVLALQTMTDWTSFQIDAPSDGDYMLSRNLPVGITVQSITTKSASGTCTLTGYINATPLGGTANSVSSAETTQAHGSANVASAGDDVKLTVSNNSSCVGLEITVKYTRALN